MNESFFGVTQRRKLRRMAFVVFLLGVIVFSPGVGFC